MIPFLQHLVRFVLLVFISALALQLYFLARVACMGLWAPQSTTFERSEIWRLAPRGRVPDWQQAWTGRAQMGLQLQRAVVAAEDADFVDHGGVEWDALESAWARNQAAQKRAERLRKRGPTWRQPKLVGGSTITQQLAKNLFLTGERNLVRKGQELAITFMLETLLPKARILELYLNHVEWGEGVFGAQAAAQHYFQAPASKLSAFSAARLAVMLPAPKRFEKNPTSTYILNRAATIQSRMDEVELP
jgi:monofunctional glycosyltransferase